MDTRQESPLAAERISAYKDDNRHRHTIVQKAQAAQ